MKILGMKNIGTLYQDQKGNTWLLKQEVLAKKRGEYKFWTATLLNNLIFSPIEYRDDFKRVLLNKISDLNKE